MSVAKSDVMIYKVDRSQRDADIILIGEGLLQTAIFLLFFYSIFLCT